MGKKNLQQRLDDIEDRLAWLQADIDRVLSLLALTDEEVPVRGDPDDWREKLDKVVEDELAKRPTGDEPTESEVEDHPTAWMRV